jgi:hypothetical protein
VQLGEYIIANTAAEIGTPSAYPFYLIANNADAIPAINIGVDGKVGIMTANAPLNFLQVGRLGSSGYTNYHLAFGNGTQASGLTILGNGNSIWQATQNISLMPTNANGIVGINTETPANKLQIGNYTNSNFSGNQIAYGVGTNVTVLNQTSTISNFQTSSELNIQSGGNIYLTPGGIDGRVGIGTNSPVAPLAVASYSNYQALGSWTYYGNGGFSASNLSIKSGGDVEASVFVSVSDVRIKDIEDVSNSSEDLATLNAIQVTDYTMKDKARNGNRQFKKIIAQQVEQVYPQIVNKGVNYIPNVYQLSNKIEKSTNGYLLGFKTAHNLNKDAKKLQLIDKNSTTESLSTLVLLQLKKVCR